ncbi:MAG: hypothetical protein ACI87W_000598 [Halieaceae bacterium]|jgi:uncharacterized protein YaiL (DUF2058 family)
MAGSLQDQLLNAGLSDTKKAKKLEKEKRKQKRTAHKSRVEVIDEVKLAVQQTREEKADRDRQLNQALNEEAHRKAVEAQIIQLIENHKLDRRGGEVGFNFTCDQKIKKFYVTRLQQKLLAAGSIAIARIAERFELIPAQVASKIAERDAQRVIFCAQETDEIVPEAERDWYQDYEIPDDLMW